TVEKMSAAVRSTCGPEVLAGVGSFGGLFDASALKAMEAPVLVASTDGVGTKVMLAERYRSYESIGQDLVNHCIDDILVQGARPLFFMDYLAASRLDPDKLARVVSGMARACREAGCALLGGETAEMPGVYAPDQFDVAGTIVGVVERSLILPRPVSPGDVLVGLRSSGPHTNGYSLIRQVFHDVPLDTVFPELNRPLGDALLEPHRSYLRVLWPRLDRVKALAHITGGGFPDNLPRVLPPGVGFRLDPWEWPPLFDLIARQGDVSREEMVRVFNLGVGMVAVLAPEDVDEFRAGLGEESLLVGELVAL
ncbi:MAG: phosphoribosylformylglycinamidine cyclo-ligase, partial [Candidatus Eremiobacterota bacterium]